MNIKFMKKVIVFASIICICVGAVPAVPVLSEETSSIKALTLKECIQMALKNRPELNMAGIDIRYAEQRIKEATSYYYPHLNLNMGYTRFHRPTTFDVDLDVTAITGPANKALDFLGVHLPSTIHEDVEVGKQNWYAVTVDLTQPIYTFGRIKEGVKQATIGHSIAEKQKQKTRLEIIADVKKAYYQFLFLKEMGRLFLEAESKARVVAKMVKIAYETAIPDKDKEGKETTRLDYLEARNFHSEIEARVIDFDKHLEMAEIALKIAMGLDITQPLDIEEIRLESIPMGMPNLKEIKETAIENNIDLKTLRLGVQLYDSKHKAAAKELLPTIAVQGQYIGPEDRIGNRNFWCAGIGLNFALFDGFSTKARASQAEMQLQKAKSQEVLLEFKFSAQIENLVKNLIGLIDKIKVLKKALQEARERIDLAADGYSAGITEYEKLLRAQRTELEMKSAYLESFYLYHVVNSEIEFIMGL